MKNKSVKKTVVAVLVLVLVIAGAISATMYHKVHAKDGAVLEGVYVGTLPLGGMSEKEAEGEVDNYVKSLMANPVTLCVDNKSVEVNASEIGVTYSAKEIAKEAYRVGHSGGLFHRYKEQKSLKKENTILNVAFSVDDKVLTTYLTDNQEKLEQETIDNGLKRENGQFVFLKGQAGTKLDIKKSVKTVKDYFENKVKTEIASVELVAERDEPQGSEEELKKVKDVLGSFSTNYSTSPAGRCQNVENATSLINGTIVYPGETFSVHDTISPIALSNGYAMAGAYENGTVVESVGGGVCQVSSTLYNAVIRAELEVVERFPHSMRVTYVNLSQDAAIAGDYKDFKFKNNMTTPIYLEGYTSGKNVYFNVYGVENRESGRTVDFETEVVSTTEPKVQYKANASAAIGSISAVQSSHTGYQAVLYKVVKINGVQQSREKFNSSTYKASPTIYEVGVKSDSAEATAAVKQAIATGDLSKIKSAIGKWSAAAIEKREKEEEDEDKKKEESQKDDDSKKNNDKDKEEDDD
ncbi:MAG: VanW family protein [Lachnospiraceae bacterium]|nr:VanW family protein [Lachnospiraceae bacterium]